MKITILGEEGVPVQVDGEAWIQPPGIVKIVHKNRAQMLTRDRVKSNLNMSYVLCRFAEKVNLVWFLHIKMSCLYRHVRQYMLVVFILHIHVYFMHVMNCIDLKYSFHKYCSQISTLSFAALALCPCCWLFLFWDFLKHIHSHCVCSLFTLLKPLRALLSQAHLGCLFPWFLSLSTAEREDCWLTGFILLKCVFYSVKRWQ